MKTPCNHKYHDKCLKEWMNIKKECPQCRKPLPPYEWNFPTSFSIYISIYYVDSLEMNLDDYYKNEKQKLRCISFQKVNQSIFFAVTRQFAKVTG